MNKTTTESLNATSTQIVQSSNASMEKYHFTTVHIFLLEHWDVTEPKMTLRQQLGTTLGLQMDARHFLIPTHAIFNM